MECEMNIKNSKLPIAAAIAALLTATAPAQALDQGDWIARVGVTHVSPDASSSPNLVDVDSGTSLGFNFTYMMSNNIGIELLAALPFEHDIEGAGPFAGAGKLAETKHLPPTLSVQYHFKPKAKFRPYVGVGLNYTTFFDEESTPTLDNALGGAGSTTDVNLDDSWGLAAQLGADFDLNDDWFANVDVRYIDISTDATLNNSVGGITNIDVDIDPWVITFALGKTF
jgi:outer membrane protein